MELSRDNWGQVAAKTMFSKEQGVVRWGGGGTGGNSNQKSSLSWNLGIFCSAALIERVSK